MPRLVKGGKWVYGWVVVGPDRAITVPPQAWDEYGFQEGEEAVFIPGSRRSGGFGLSTARLLARSRLPFDRGRVLGRGRIGEAGRLFLPGAVDVQPGQKLLAVRGSGFALGFATRGPIFEEALNHPELERFSQ